MRAIATLGASLAVLAFAVWMAAIGGQTGGIYADAGRDAAPIVASR
ncbi:MAG TPA: hypothetical protein VGS12_05935 [Caulobacteraceae bacterium]|nr:hypothetical protein [Caulobacteraceae bacterium]